MPRVSDGYRAERRSAILAAAGRCFARDGFSGTSMESIIAECGMSSGAVYSYFSGKDDIVIGVVEANLGSADALFESLLKDGAVPSPAELIDVAINAFTTFGAFHPVTGADTSRMLVHVWSESLRDPEVEARSQAGMEHLRDNYAEVARRWKEAGHLPADADPTNVGAVILGIFQSFIIQRLFLPGTSPANYIAAVHALLDSD
jgi:AcrR family transcriptional regulator